MEYIRKIVIKRTGDKNFFHVAKDFAYPSPALVLLDGVPFNDADFILGLDPLKVEQIDVVNESYQIGMHQFDGIVNFLTYQGDLAGTSLPSNVIEKMYVSLQAPREFYSPDYSNPVDRQNRIPDFRNLLYWEPDITIGSLGSVNLEFFTSDDSGNYKIDLQGISHDGTPLWANFEFQVTSDF